MARFPIPPPSKAPPIPTKSCRLSLSESTGRPVVADDAERRVILGDGALWIWNIASELFPDAIVDLFHAKQHLWEKAKEIYGNGEFAEAWARRQCSILEEDHVDKVIAALRKHDAAGYLERNRARMQYGKVPTSRAVAYPSGVVKGRRQKSQQAETGRNAVDRSSVRTLGLQVLHAQRALRRLLVNGVRPDPTNRTYTAHRPLSRAPPDRRRPRLNKPSGGMQDLTHERLARLTGVAGLASAAALARLPNSPGKPPHPGCPSRRDATAPGRRRGSGPSPPSLSDPSLDPARNLAESLSIPLWAARGWASGESPIPTERSRRFAEFDRRRHPADRAFSTRSMAVRVQNPLDEAGESLEVRRPPRRSADGDFGIREDGSPAPGQKAKWLLAHGEDPDDARGYRQYLIHFPTPQFVCRVVTCRLAGKAFAWKGEVDGVTGIRWRLPIPTSCSANSSGSTRRPNPRFCSNCCRSRETF